MDDIDLFFSGDKEQRPKPPPTPIPGPGEPLRRSQKPLPTPVPGPGRERYDDALSPLRKHR